MIQYNFNQEKNYIEATFTGKINQGEIVNYINSLMKENQLPENLKGIIDAREASFNIHPADLYNILSENVKMFSRFNSLKVAIIIKNPVDTALAMIFTRLIQLERYLFKVFTTETAAERWINERINNENKKYPNNTFVRNIMPN